MSYPVIKFASTAETKILKQRALFYRLLRSYFDQNGYVEVATPTLSRDVVVDRFVESIPVYVERCWQEPDDFVSQRFNKSKDGSIKPTTTFYLQTSPEFCMKRLLASGMDAIYQICPAFRRGDRGKFHNVEFTMLEWYRAGVDYEEGRDILAALIQQTTSQFLNSINEPIPDWAQNVVQIPFTELFLERTGLNPHLCSSEDLHKFADKQNVTYPDSYADIKGSTLKDDWLDLIFSEVIQPSLGFDAITILYDYPATQSQLAKTSEQIDRQTGNKNLVSRRYELFIQGVELANGYDELLDSRILRDRIQATAKLRRLDGSPELPKESRLLAAMDSGLPECSGCALGVDRFLMVLLKKKSIDDVISFPIEFA